MQKGMYSGSQQKSSQFQWLKLVSRPVKPLNTILTPGSADPWSFFGTRMYSTLDGCEI